MELILISVLAFDILVSDIVVVIRIPYGIEMLAETGIDSIIVLLSVFERYEHILLILTQNIIIVGQRTVGLDEIRIYKRLILAVIQYVIRAVDIELYTRVNIALTIAVGHLLQKVGKRYIVIFSAVVKRDSIIEKVFYFNFRAQ